MPAYAISGGPGPAAGTIGSASASRNAHPAAFAAQPGGRLSQDARIA